MQRRLTSRKILVASAGVGAVSYLIGCGQIFGENPSSGNLMGVDFPDSGYGDEPSDNSMLAQIIDAGDEDAAPGLDAGDEDAADTDAADTDGGLDEAGESDAANGGD